MTGIFRSCQPFNCFNGSFKNLLGASVLATQSLCGHALAQGMASPSDYNALITQARNGMHQPALDYFSQRQELTASQRLDQLIITSWNGQDQATAELYDNHAGELSAFPDATFIAARARRNLQQWPQALALLESLHDQHPGHIDYRLALIMTLADAGQTQRAQDEGKRWTSEAPTSIEARLGYGYALMRAEAPFAALFEFDQALQMAPDRRDVRREYIFALQRAGLSTPALALARQDSLMSETELRRLEADQLSEQIRLSVIPMGAHRDRHTLTDRALAQSEALLAEWQNLPPQESIRIRLDRLGALRSRLAMHQLKSEAEQLISEGTNLPGYAQRWYADALLYLRNPESAADIYRELIAHSNPRDASWISDHQQLYYALVEAEMLDEADALSHELSTQQPAYRPVPGTLLQVVNGRWLDAQVLSANNHIYRDDMPAAERTFADLVSDAPGNTGLRTSLASVYQLRGWPRRAERELKIAESTDPVNLGVLATQAGNALALQDWEPFEILADDLAQRYPEILANQRVQRQRQIHHMYELQITAYTDTNNGDGVNGSGGFGIDSLLYSQPLHQDWRVFGGLGYATGKFEEGRANYHWQRAGLEWRIRDHTVSAELSANHYGHGAKAGWKLSGDHEFNDYWQYGWELEGLSRHTPLRALNSNTDADRQAVYVRWRAHERREWQLDLSAMAFSDGNERLQAGISGKERLITQPYLTLDANLQVTTSRNSQGNAGLYFNPESDLTLLPGLSLNHIIDREYQQIWSQQAYLGLGTYSQNGFGTGAMISASYGQRWLWNEQLNTGLMLSASSRPYDGERELGLALLFDLTYRF
ncbi:poly-beta-1,6 N-acetyl-D-glucosamine export porin PgaA [Marinobacter zhejiangensis]|uniref:Biofilm PGA synthesis protein PgaA n=1 Tax=Marinobacter zhejiangensis TaxID=488535 RepID=A0A1I4PFJ3_9GAMM|nr:poly-beta-1,6 N-acetyl-D-glucosamine export porin PgaA [Marinobacter zhejiangensis]SFM26440.1 biofilm PGA synthesis protein PgaA [Marinobacter zhejiangensis]